MSCIFPKVREEAMSLFSAENCHKLAIYCKADSAALPEMYAGKGGIDVQGQVGDTAVVSQERGGWS